MARIFDVGPLPQITTPNILDTQPLVPFDLASMGKALNDKTQLDIYKGNAERQRRAMELSYLDKFSDNLQQMLKGPDGNFLNPISPYHQQTFDSINKLTNESISKMSDLLEADDYRGAYKTMFDAKSRIATNTDYKRTLQELNLFNQRLNDKDLDPYAVQNLYTDMQKSDKAFDLNRLNRSELALYDEPTSVETFYKGIKPEEVLGYDGYKYETQATPSQIRENFKGQIQASPEWQRYLSNRGVDVSNPDQLDKYVNSRLAGQLIGEKAGAEYIYQTVDGKETLVGVKRLIGYDKALGEAGDPAKSSGGGGDMADIWGGQHFKSQGFIVNTPETVDYPSFRNAYRKANEEYLNQRQALDVQFSDKNIEGLISPTGDKIQDIVETVLQYGSIEEARKVIKITNKQGIVDEKAEDDFFKNVYPNASMDYAKREVFNKGQDYLLQGTYDKIKKEYEKNNGGTAFDALGITKGANGEIIFPENFDLDKRDSESITTNVNGIPRIMGANTEGQDRNKIRDLHAKYVDDNLKKRYDNFFKEDADAFQVYQIPDETGKEYAPWRLIQEGIEKQVKIDQATFYSQDYDVAKGLPTTLRELSLKDKPMLDAAGAGGGAKAWNGVDIEGIGIDPVHGTFFAYGYPRLSISGEQAAAFEGAKTKFSSSKTDAISNQYVEKVGGDYFLKSKKAIMIPWNSFGTKFYTDFFNKYKTYEGLYSGLVSNMEEKVPDGQPVPLNIGGQLVYITPHGPLGTNDRVYSVVAPPPIAKQIDGQGPTPPGVSSNTDPVQVPKTVIDSPPKPTMETKLDVIDNATDILNKYPHLKEFYDDLSTTSDKLMKGIGESNLKEEAAKDAAKQESNKHWSSVSQDMDDMTVDNIVKRQIQVESGGNQSAVSPKGNVGKMQLSEAAGKEAAKYLGIEYDPKRMVSDGDYNVQLGKGYLNMLLDDFGVKESDDTVDNWGNREIARVLAVAAYNAGPTRVKELLNTHGDPRAGTISIDEFITKLPKETQNYVSEVLERKKPVNPGADFLENANASAKVYQTDAKGLSEILTRGASYINGLSVDQKEQILNPVNFTSLDFKANQYKTNTPVNVTGKTASALAHFDSYVGEQFEGRSKAIITDTFRTKEQNSGTTGSGEDSRHMHGDAFDISMRGAGTEILDRVIKARAKGKAELDALYLELFGTTAVKFEKHTAGTAEHIHVEIL